MSFMRVRDAEINAAPLYLPLMSILQRKMKNNPINIISYWLEYTGRFWVFSDKKWPSWENCGGIRHLGWRPHSVTASSNWPIEVQQEVNAKYYYRTCDLIHTSNSLCKTFQFDLFSQATIESTLSSFFTLFFSVHMNASIKRVSGLFMHANEVVYCLTAIQ